MLKNTATKLIVFCWDVTTGLPKTGDAANLTAYRSLDFGSVTVLGDTSATEMDATNAKGYYLFDLTAGETNGDINLYTCKSSTSNIACVAVPAVVHTIPATGLLAPATAGRTLVVDASGLADANAVKVGPTGSGTAQTARDLGASVLLSSGTGTGQLDFTSGVVKANATQWLGGTIPAVNVTGVPKVDVVDWLGTAPLALSSQQVQAIVPDTQKVDLNTIKTNPVVNAGTVTFPTGATLASTTNITAGTITTVTTTTTATNLTNAPTSGDFTATMKTSIGTAVAASAVASVTAAVTLSAGDSPTFYTGTATAGGASTLTDSGQTWTVNGLAGCRVKITSGTGTKQSRVIVSNTATALTVDRAWTTNPDNTSVYAVVEGEAPALSSGLKVTGVSLVDALTTYTGNTVQTGDSFARIGLAGVGLTNLGDTRIANLDAAVSSRMATYTQPTGFLAATFPATVASTTNITAGTITTVTNQLTAAQIATGVWTDTTAGDFTTATSPGKIVFTQLGGAFTNTSSSVFTTAALANAPGGGSGVTVNGYASGQDPATLVLDAVAASHNTSGTIGQKINAAGSAADPLLNAVPGSYASGTAGAALGRITAVSVNVASPVAANADTTVIRGDDYYTTDTRSLVYTDAGNIFPDSSTPVWKLIEDNTGLVALSITGTLSPSTGSGKTVTVEVPRADFDALTLSTYRLAIVFTRGSGHVETLVQGRCTIEKR